MSVHNTAAVSYNLLHLIGDLTGSFVGADFPSTGLKIRSNVTPDLSGTPTALLQTSVGGASPQHKDLNLGTIAMTSGSLLYLIVTIDIDALATTGHTIKVNNTTPITATFSGGAIVVNNISGDGAIVTVGT